MTAYTVQCAYAAWRANTVSVEADGLEEALERAIARADADDAGWKSSDHCGPTFVEAAAEGRDAEPWSGSRSALPIPERFTERGAPPVVTLTGPRPPGGVRVTGGVVHLRFVTDVGAVTTEVSESSPPPGAKPLVTVRRRRADGLPDVTVTGGLARVQILDEEV